MSNDTGPHFLPEIPDEAVRALTDRIKAYPAQPSWSGAIGWGATPEELIGAAWPYLYAAALRHAANALVSQETDDNSHESERDPALWLHLMADEAVRSSGNPLA